jgi:pimeloyl-ACP methyl ester carboxylesterase
MGLGRQIDLLAGEASKLLHGIRGPKINTVPQLGPYLDRSPAALNPEPPPLTEVRVHGSLASRFSHTVTLSWKSTHHALGPEYAVRQARDYKYNQTAWGRWVRPNGTQRRHCLLYIHGWLEPGSWIEERLVFPTWTRELDVDVLHVALPFHGRRNARTALFSGEYYFTADLVRSFEGLLQATHDARSALGWLRRQGYESVGATGISLGGSLAMLLACLEPTPDYVIPIVAHLRLGEAVERATILWRVKRDLERWGVHESERRRIFERLGLDSASPVLSPSKQLWIEAREDGHIDPALVKEQWEAWGRPNLHWIPGGHMTFPLHLAEITRVMKDFIRTTL